MYVKMIEKDGRLLLLSERKKRKRILLYSCENIWQVEIARLNWMVKGNEYVS